jgi:uncharacterized membrane protein
MLIVSDIRREAWDKLTDNWSKGILIWLVWGVLSSFNWFLTYSIVLSVFSSFYSLFIIIPVTAGANWMFLKLVRDNEYLDVNNIFKAFQIWTRVITTYILIGAYVLLWTLCLIIPGIIASIAYSQAPFIILDDPDINPADALRLSKRMMEGYKWDYLRFVLSYIGWIFLGAITFGIGMLWVQSYIFAGNAAFYLTVKEIYNKKTTFNNSELDPDERYKDIEVN